MIGTSRLQHFILVLEFKQLEDEEEEEEEEEEPRHVNDSFLKLT